MTVPQKATSAGVDVVTTRFLEQNGTTAAMFMVTRTYNHSFNTALQAKLQKNKKQ